MKWLTPQACKWMFFFFFFFARGRRMNAFCPCRYDKQVMSRLRGHNWVLLPYRLQYTVTFNSNFAIIKTWNCFQLKSKNYLSLQFCEKKKPTGFCFWFCFCFLFLFLFCFVFLSIFSGNRSFSNARCFYGKKRKIMKGNLYLNEIWFSRNEMWCGGRWLFTIICVTYVQKDF